MTPAGWAYAPAVSPFQFAGTGFDTPTGIVADQNSFFAAHRCEPFILVSDQGTIFHVGPDAQAICRRRRRWKSTMLREARSYKV